MSEFIETKTVTISKCPRCGSTNVGIKTPKNNTLGRKIGVCKECDLKIESASVGYIGWMFNTPKEDLVRRCFTELTYAPYTSYVNQDLVDIWDGLEALKHYITRETGWKIDVKEAKNVGNGWILDRIG